jgi:hypothetical protein
MRTEQAIREFIASRIAQNLSKRDHQMVPGKAIPIYEGLPCSTKAPGTHRIFLLHRDFQP